MVACNDDDMTTTINPINQLPPATMTGENTFGCLINGEPWVAQVNNHIDNKLDVIFNPFFNELQFHARIDASGQRERILMAIVDVVGEGEYDLIYLDKMLRDWENATSYELDTLESKKLILHKFDEANKIVSGIFEFTVFRENDTLKITDGRFDASYRN